MLATASPEKVPRVPFVSEPGAWRAFFCWGAWIVRRARRGLVNSRRLRIPGRTVGFRAEQKDTPPQIRPASHSGLRYAKLSHAETLNVPMHSAIGVPAPVQSRSSILVSGRGSSCGMFFPSSIVRKCNAKSFGDERYCAYSIWLERIRRSTLMTANLHHRILATPIRRYGQRIMNNVCRSDYIECMVASVLGADRRPAGNQAGCGKTVMGSRSHRGPAATVSRNRLSPGLPATGWRSMDRGTESPCASLRFRLARALRQTCRPPQRRTVAVPCHGGKRPAFQAEEQRILGR